jgi:hypothetical protein
MGGNLASLGPTEGEDTLGTDIPIRIATYDKYYYFSILVM